MMSTSFGTKNASYQLVSKLLDAIRIVEGQTDRRLFSFIYIYIDFFA